MFESDLAKRVRKLEVTVAEQQTIINLLLGHERLEVKEVPEVYIPEHTVLVAKKR